MKWLPAATLLLLALLFVPVFPAKYATYRCVGTPRSEYYEGVLAPASEGRFIVRHGKVYVLEMLQWQAVFVVTRGEFVKWSAEELQALREHEDLQDPTLWE